MRIALWSGPRNVSTALMYSFRQRPDTAVIDEPLYAHYLATTGADHPGREEVLADQNPCGEEVVRDVLLGPTTRPVTFFKSMAHHLVGLDTAFMPQLSHVLLTREPEAMLASLCIQIPEPTLEATGLPHQVALLDAALARGTKPIVLVADTLRTAPAATLSSLCDRLQIPWTDAMLAWPEGPKPEDGVWAPHWYHRVHTTRRFEAPGTPRPLPDRLRPLLRECQPLFERLREHQIC